MGGRISQTASQRVTATMKAMILRKTGSLDQNPEPLDLVEVPTPEARDDEIRIKVATCGVCHTELDEIEGRTPPAHLPMILGHQVIGRVDQVGKTVSAYQVGDRVGVGWIYCSDGSLCENLSPAFRATGRDANGGYAEYMTIQQEYAYPIPPQFSDDHAAPLLCAGAIGFRSLRLTELRDGDCLGLTGFGGSAHLVIQMVRQQFPESRIHVFARNPNERQFARELGAVWAGDTTDRSPEKLRAIIDTTPAWTPVVEALNNLAPGGRLVINAIRKTDADKSCLMDLDYGQHLWMEREIKSVANITSRDIAQFLSLAARIPLVPKVVTYPLEEANRALNELKQGEVTGAKVLVINEA